MSFFHKNLTLVIDAGNTNVLFALAQESGFIVEFRQETNARATADDLAVWLLPLLQLNKMDFKDLQGAVISSVVPALDYSLRAFVRKYLTLEPIFISPTMPNLPFQIKIQNPAQLGADRLANAAAVRMAYPLPAIVIDLGTATTFDIVDSNGDYIGGVIAPGPLASLRALSDTTAKLPHIHMTRPAAALGTDTVSAMQSGLFWGYVGLINGILTRLQLELGAAHTIIATGGLVNLFKEHIRGLSAVDQEITLKGAMLLSHQAK